MNRTVRVLGVLAAVLFGGYWWASDDVRQVEAAFDDVVEMLGIDDDPGYGGRFTDDPEARCRRTGERMRMLSSRTKFDRVGEQRLSIVAPEAYPVWEEFAQVAEANGWTVRRFVSQGELRLHARRGDVVFLVQAFGQSRPGLLVTLDDCLGENSLPLEEVGGRLREGWQELGVFERP